MDPIQAPVEHTATFEHPNDHYQVRLGDQVIVDTSRAIIVKEVSERGVYPPVLYFPIEDTRKELLEPTDLHTRCPIKGEASYFSVSANGKVLENAAWFYPSPSEQVSEIAGYLSFYSDKVEIQVID